MVSSKQWFSVIGSSIVRSSNLYKSSNIINPTRLPSHLHLVREHCSSAAVDTWPEWVTFVDRLKSKGYFPNDTNTCQIHLDSISDSDSKLLNTASLSFARHRFDLFESLSLLDIQTLVEKGCPTLFRKVIDSAKRLRAHLLIDEVKVCRACNQRGRCNKYLEILVDDEGSARTVDVVRILLIYALDPEALSKVTISSDRVIIEESARRLFSQLIELSDTLPAPEIPITSVPAPRIKKKPVEFDENDWRCPQCKFMNFARNIRCKKCQGNGPKQIETSVELKYGEWICPGCGFMHYANKTSCFRCRVQRPPIELKPGEWECSSCSYRNSRQSISCKKCNLYRPRTGRTLS